MPKILRCALCKASLTVNDNAPKRLTCPRCLASVPNPSDAPPLQPSRMIELDRQVRADSQTTKILAGMVAILVLMGCALMVLGFDLVPALITIITISLVIGACILIQTGGMAHSQYDTRPVDRVDHRDGSSRILDYHQPQPRPRRAKSIGTVFGQAFVGVIVGVGGIITCGVVTRAEASFFIIPVIGIIIVIFGRGIRGFGIGIILALPIVFLVIVGMCSGWFRF